MAITRADIDAGDELQQLKVLVAEQQQRLDVLEGHEDSPNGGETKEKRSTRRQMLKLAGATLVGAAGSAALRAIPAAAADNDTVTVGHAFSETLGNVTGINATGPTYNTAVYGAAGYGGIGVYGSAGNSGKGVLGSAGTFGNGVSGEAGGYATGVRGSAGLGGVGVRGTSDVTYGSGVVGYGNAGVFGEGTSYGVFAVASQINNGIGVYANAQTGVVAYTGATNSRALYAYTASTGSVAIQAKSAAPGGIFSGGAPAIAAQSTGAMGLIAEGYMGGVMALSTNSYASGLLAAGKTGGPDLKLFGSGRMIQVSNITGGVGAPAFTPAAGYFEMVRAYDGAMWINRGGLSTGQAQWKRINAVRVDSSDGLGSPFKPKRVIDTRVGAIKAAGSMTLVTVAGVGTGTSNIPSDAVAVIGNLTAVAYTGGGFLAIMPGGILKGTGADQYNPLVDPSTVNFIVGQGAISNGFVCGLHSGQVQVYVAGHSSHFIIDITGYMQ